MDNEISDVDESEYPQETDKPRKRKRGTKRTEAAKQRRLSGHVAGNDCNCNRFQCFKTINQDERDNLIMKFNTDFRTKDEQDSYLCTLITVKNIAQRRPRQPKETANLRDHSYSYECKVIRNEDVAVIPVCHKAFLSIFGISNRRLQTLKTALVTTGKNKNLRFIAMQSFNFTTF